MTASGNTIYDDPDNIYDFSTSAIVPNDVVALHALSKQFNLSFRELYFCEQYLEGLSPIRAASKAKYIQPYAGKRLLAKPEIQNYLAARFQQQKVSADETLALISAIARSDMGDLYTLSPDGKTVEFNLADVIMSGKSNLIKSIKPTKFGLNIEMYSRMDALTLMARHHKLLTDIISKPDDEKDVEDLSEAAIIKRLESIIQKVDLLEDSTTIDVQPADIATTVKAVLQFDDEISVE